MINNLKIEIGMMFKDDMNDYWEITGLVSQDEEIEEVHFIWAHNLEDLKNRDNIEDDYVSYDDCVRAIEESSIVPLETKRLSWRERLK